MYVSRHSFTGRLAIVDRLGSVEPVLEAPVREYDTPKLSPDESQILVSVRAGSIDQDVWVYDLRRRTLRRLTTDGDSRRALWTADGLGVTFDRRYGRGDNAFSMSASGEDDAATQITRAPVHASAGGWGNDFLFSRRPQKTLADIWIVTHGRPETARPLIGGERIQWGRPSPDGRCLAIVHNETGVFEGYLTTLPTPDAPARLIWNDPLPSHDRRIGGLTEGHSISD